MAKKLDAQTKSFDNNIEALSMLVQEQLCTNQQNLHQILQDHRNNDQMSATTEGPHNKCQKHGDEDVEAVEVMGNKDTLCHNRDAHAPDPGG
eukprot:76206-Ditylum_brightwellii.AAC.1